MNELLERQVKELREASNCGDFVRVGQAVEQVRPSPAAFWRFIGELSEPWVREPVQSAEQ